MDRGGPAQELRIAAEGAAVTDAPTLTWDSGYMADPPTPAPSLRR